MPVSELLYSIAPSPDSTLAIEVIKTGLRRSKKHLLFFEKFSGTLHYVAERPESSRANILIDANSVVCRDTWLNARKQKSITEYAKHEVLVTDAHPEIRFASTSIAAKPLRGFVVQGEMQLCDVTRPLRVNVVLNEKRHDTIQIDGDATLTLSDFGIKPPSSFFGLIGTKDQALIRILLWATPLSSSQGQLREFADTRPTSEGSQTTSPSNRSQ
jgi:polyisoprenoid-binding protein YceI